MWQLPLLLRTGESVVAAYLHSLPIAVVETEAILRRQVLVPLAKYIPIAIYVVAGNGVVISKRVGSCSSPGIRSRIVLQNPLRYRTDAGGRNNVRSRRWIDRVCRTERNPDPRAVCVLRY